MPPAGLSLAVVVFAVCLGALAAAAGAWRGSRRVSVDAVAVALPLVAAPAGLASLDGGLGYLAMVGALLVLTLALTAWAALGEPGAVPRLRWSRGAHGRLGSSWSRPDARCAAAASPPLTSAPGGPARTKPDHLRAAWRLSRRLRRGRKARGRVCWLAGWAGRAGVAVAAQIVAA